MAVVQATVALPKATPWLIPGLLQVMPAVAMTGRGSLSGSKDKKMAEVARSGCAAVLGDVTQCVSSRHAGGVFTAALREVMHGSRHVHPRAQHGVLEAGARQ